MRSSAEVADLTHRLPTPEEIASAAEAATALAANRDKGAIVLSGSNGTTLRLAPAISDLIVDVLGFIARGDLVTIAPFSAMLTTQQAADILNVSRPHLSGLLKDGKIPFTPVGSHRRVRFEDLMSFKEHRDKGRNEALEKLAQLGQEFDAS
jgi:excisionase family DNA binding protein